MARSIRLLLLLVIALSITFSSSGEERERNLSLDVIVNLLNETKWILAQHSQVNGSGELKEMVRQLWQERQDERERRRDDDEELRHVKEGGDNMVQLQLHSALDNLINLQGRVLAMQREMHELEVQQQQHLAVLNTSPTMMVEKQQLDLLALNKSITRLVEEQQQQQIPEARNTLSLMHGRESEMVQQNGMNQIQETLANMNDSFFIQLRDNQMMQERELQQLRESLNATNRSYNRSESEVVQQAEMNQLKTFLIAMNNTFFSRVNESQEARKKEVQELQASLTAITSSVRSADEVQELLLRCRNENEAAADALTVQAIQLDRRLSNNVTMTRVIQNDTVPSTCNGSKVLNGTQGSLAVSEYDYVNGMNCGWRLVTPPGSTVVLKWRKLETEQCCDRVTVKDATGTPIAIISGDTSNNLQPDMVVLTNEVEVTFRTDGSATRKGFQLDYQALQTP